jgi:hypothetical protein
MARRRQQSSEEKGGFFGARKNEGGGAPGIRQERDSEEAGELLETGFTQIYRIQPPGIECSTPHSCKIEVEKEPNVRD